MKLQTLEANLVVQLAEIMPDNRHNFEFMGDAQTSQGFGELCHKSGAWAVSLADSEEDSHSITQDGIEIGFPIL
jgi:hypothetical protein